MLRWGGKGEGRPGRIPPLLPGPTSQQVVTYTRLVRTCRGKVVARSKTDKGKGVEGEPPPHLFGSPSDTESAPHRLGKLRPIGQWRFPDTIVVLFS